MAPLVTPTELIVWLDIPADTFPLDRATLLVDSASAAVRAHCGWNITAETLTDQVVDGSGGWDIYLPTKHLTAVASVTENGTVLTDPEHYTWYRNGRLTRSSRWTSKAKGVEVDYTHGYPTGHVRLELARSVCLTAASRKVYNPSSRSSYTVGGVSESYGNSADVDSTVILTEGEKDSLLPLVLHGVAG